MTKCAKACYSLALVAFGSGRSLAFIRFPNSGASFPSRPIYDSLFVHALTRNNHRHFTMSNNEGTTAAIGIEENLRDVKERIVAAAEECSRPVDGIRLVAVSKTKPLELLKEAYAAGQRVFGENYAQELVEKAGQMPNDVQWHFIGSLQSNKANLLIKSVVPVSDQLTVETVSSMKLANKLNNAMNSLEEIPQDKKLNIFIQVNTSGEQSKSGIEPSEVVDLCKDITAECDRLHIQGLMTIGAPGDMECFDVLSECRNEVSETLGMANLELSMGMSGDFEEAIARGATNVRVGSTIFGARDYSNKN